ncbi:MAG: hypothetical protein P8O03_10310 [Ilumatobacter sp.]|nr:hypothetical protein [Ilumatobacter sp.]
MNGAFRLISSRARIVGLVFGITAASGVMVSMPSSLGASDLGGDATAVLGLESLNSGGDAQIFSVSCSEPGECAAAGYYTDAAGRQGFVVTRTGGIWRDAEPIPALKALNGGNRAEAYSVSCAVPGECAVTGYYTGGAGRQAFVVTQTGGIWRDAEPIPGIAFLNGGDKAESYSVSCAAVGECAATGVYRDNNAKNQGFVVSQTNGEWGNAEPIPGLEVLNEGVMGTAAGASVSCAAPGECAATGWYTDFSGQQGFVVSQTGGEWGSAKATAKALNFGSGRGLSVSCAAPGECSATGTYEDDDGTQSFVATQADGLWEAAIPIPNLKAQNIGNYAVPSAVSCAAPGECSATGAYEDDDGTQGFVATQADGLWEAAIPIPNLKAQNIGNHAVASAVSCSVPGECTATGFYKPGIVTEGFVVTQTKGEWGRAIPIPGLRPLNTGGIATSGSVSCAAPGACYVVGQYKDNNGYQGFVADVLSPFAPVGPTRAVDTRKGRGVLQPVGSTLSIDVGSEYANQSISVNLTVPGAVGRGYATLYACDQPRPATSSLNYQPNQSIANGVITKVSGDGEVCVYLNRQAHVVLDVFGVFPD